MNTNRRLRKSIVGLMAVAAIGIGMPAAAGAQAIDGSEGPTADQYKSPVVKVDTSTGANDDGSGLTEPVGPLPFTGFDVIAMLGVALAVTGLGLALQRAVSNRPQDQP